MYKSISAQSFHYFARPQQSVPLQPLSGPDAWQGNDYPDESDWIISFTKAEIAEIETACERAEQAGMSLQGMQASDLPLPGLAARIREWRAMLAQGRGFVVLRGLPVERWPESRCELFFWCFGWQLGIPGAQNRYGDLLGHVRDTGESPDDPGVREYRTAVGISFHCDAADVVGLFCLRRAQQGGYSRIASSVTIYNLLLQEQPELVERLFRPFALDARAEGGLNWFPVAPCRFDQGRLRTFYHSGYFRSAQRYSDAPRLTEDELALLDAYDEIADRPGIALSMDLQPGDIQLLSNHSVVHSRTAYTDHPQPELRRHLLRLWLSLPATEPLSSRLRRSTDALQVAVRLVQQKLFQKRR